MKIVVMGLGGLLALAPMGRGQSATPAGSPPPRQVFSPAKNPYAKRLVTETFQIVQDLDGIDPEVRTLFFTKVPRRDIANRGGKFNATDVVTERGVPTRRLVIAGSAPGMWFVLYEHGGRGYHYNLIVFAPDGSKHWQVAAAPAGFVKHYANLGDLKAALNQGAFEEQPGYFDY